MSSLNQNRYGPEKPKIQMTPFGMGRRGAGVARFGARRAPAAVFAPRARTVAAVGVRRSGVGDGLAWRYARVLAVVVGLCGSALAGCPAGAVAGPLVLSSRFNGASTPAGSFSTPGDLAVDQASGDVFVVDQHLDDVVDEYSVNASGEAAYVRQITGRETPQMAFEFAGEPAGVTVEGSTGDVYVADTKHNVVDKFELVGGAYKYVCQLTGYGSGCHRNLSGEEGTPDPAFQEPLGVAIDSRGNLFVADYEHKAVYEFDGTGANVEKITGSAEHPIEHPAGLAFDAAGNLYVQRYEGAVVRLAANLLGKIEPEAPALLFDGETSHAVAVDRATGEVYVDQGIEVARYAASGVPLPPVGEEATIGGSSKGVAFGEHAGNLYVSDASSEPISEPDSIAVFSSPPPLPPLVGDERASDVASASASIDAQVNPEYFATTYQVQYVQGDGYDAASPNPYAAGAIAPAHPGSVGSGGVNLDVSVPLMGLQPGTTYHYRVLAINEHGATPGADHTFTTYPSGGPFALPDGRVYEMVTPVDKNGTDLNPGFGTVVTQGSASGDEFAYSGAAEFEEPQNGDDPQYISMRNEHNWETRSIALPLTTTEGAFNQNHYYAFSADLSSAILLQTDPTLSTAAPQGYQDLYLRESDGTNVNYTPLITETPKDRPPNLGQIFYFRAEFADATPDFRHIIFQANDALTSNAIDPGEQGFNLYEWAGGRLELINLPPGQTTGDPNARFGGDPNLSETIIEHLDLRNTISNDGSRVFWTDEDVNNPYFHDLMVRENVGTAQARTVQVDAPQGGSGDGGDGIFWGASGDGSKVFFTDGGNLTSEGSSRGDDLYEYNLNKESLTDLTVDTSLGDKEGANVQGVLGNSMDGSYVYFVAEGALASGASSGKPGLYNLYLWHEGPGRGTITFIGSLSREDDADWVRAPTQRAAVTPDGLHLAFMSEKPLTGYDNIDVNTGTRDAEVYIYDAANSGKLVCASCNPSGAQPAGKPLPSTEAGQTLWENVAAHVPIWTSATYQPRYLSSDGDRLFFDSSEALVPQDTNGLEDVYEWEENGTGSCGRTGGCVYLISNGTSSDKSEFDDAGEKGSDVFFTTRAQLVPQDADQLSDEYDARVGGGFPEPTAPECTGTGCQGVPSVPPIFATPSSLTFNGVGNFAPANFGMKPLTRAQKLARALKACRFEHNNHKRAICEARARKRYGPSAKAKKLLRARK